MAYWDAVVARLKPKTTLPNPLHHHINTQSALRPRLSLATAKKIAGLVLVFGCWLLFIIVSAVTLKAAGSPDTAFVVFWIALLTALKAFLVIWVVIFRIWNEEDQSDDDGGNNPASCKSGCGGVEEMEMV